MRHLPNVQMKMNNQYKGFAEMQSLFLCSQVNGKAPKDSERFNLIVFAIKTKHFHDRA